MWRSGSESKPVHSRYSRLSQVWRTAKPIRIISAVSNWFRCRTSHELNSLNSIWLMWSTASEPALRKLFSFHCAKKSLACTAGIFVLELAIINSLPYWLGKIGWGGGRYFSFQPNSHSLGLFCLSPSLFQVWIQDGAHLIKMRSLVTSLAKIRLHCRLKNSRNIGWKCNGKVSFLFGPSGILKRTTSESGPLWQVRPVQLKAVQGNPQH